MSVVYDPGKDFYECESCGASWAGDKGMTPGYCPQCQQSLSLGEVRVIDPTTGGEKGQKPQRFSLIPVEFLWALAEHYGVGARKYADRNWERGYKWSLSLDASERHKAQFLLGERFDKETGSHHLIAAIWHLVALYIFDMRNLGTNDITAPMAPLTFSKI